MAYRLTLSAWKMKEKNSYKHFPINALIELIHDCDSNEYLGDENGEKNGTGILED